MITKEQIKKIHYLKNKLGLTEDEYRAMLWGYNVESSKEMKYYVAKDLIQKLEGLLETLKQVQGGLLKQVQGEILNSTRRKKYDELGIRWNEDKREHYATPKQLRMIEAMWMTSEVVDQKNMDAFLKFVKRITGVDKMEWLMMSDVRKIVKAIKELKKSKKNGMV
jgi:hypothetical protein